MNGRNDGSSVIALFAVIGVFLFIGFIVNASTPRCIRSGCDNEQASGSSYCYLHKPYTGGSSYKSNTTKSTSKSTSKTYSSGSSSSKSSTSKSTSSGSKNTKNGSTSKKKSTSISNPYKSYDEGYEAVYEDDDYDWDRYYSDSDYADGVDDAMDDLDW